MNAKIEPIVGRYINLELLGRAQRIYFEEAGQGIPLLCLHTAGSDGRQYRELFNDEDITRRFRVICFDMPWHGKSSPPEGWQDETYQLTSDAYMGMVLSICDALSLDRPVAMGCSIGGRIVLHLARSHPDRFRALIGLQSGGHVDPYYDIDWLYRPDTHGEVAAAVVSGLVAPTAPAKDRWETLWHYMQGGPGIFKGDLHFYKFEGDIRSMLADIDVSRCPVYLLTGEYDYSCTPEDTKVVASEIGVDPVIMREMGHFPMSESPVEFREYLLPVLRQIEEDEAPT